MRKLILLCLLSLFISFSSPAVAAPLSEMMFLMQIPTTGAPSITSIDPSSTIAGGPAFSLTVNGANFVNGSTVRWNNASRGTTFVSATRLTAAIPASDIAAAGTAAVTVVHPGGTASNAVTFTIVVSSDTTLYFAQIAEGKSANGTNKTVLITVNPNDRPVSISVEFFTPSGDPFAVDVGIGNLASFEVTVAAKSQAVITTAGTRSTASAGWVRMKSRDRFGALALYQFFNIAGDFVTEAGVAPSQLAKNFIVTAEFRDDFESGLALVNPAILGAAAVTLRLRDQSGTIVTTASVQLGPKQHSAKFLRELFTAVIAVGFQGTIEIESDQPLAATTLRTLRKLQTSTLPVVAIP